MLDALGVGERVGGDRDGDAQAEEQIAPVVLGRSPGHRHDPGRDPQHPRHLHQRSSLGEHHRAGRQHQHRGHPAGHRVDDAHLPAPVGPGQQRDIGHVQRRRGRGKGQRVALEAPGEQGDRPQQRHPRERGHRRGRLAVPCARQEHVPARVHQRGGQREQQCGKGHRGARSLLSPPAAPSSTPSREPRCRAAARPAAPPRGRPTRRSPPRCRGRCPSRGCPPRASR